MWGLTPPSHACLAPSLQLSSLIPGSACCAVHAIEAHERVRKEAAVYEAHEWAEDSAVLLQEWIDHKLSWNPDEYGGITAIRVPSESLWLPDIVLFEK